MKQGSQFATFQGGAYTLSLIFQGVFSPPVQDFSVSVSG